MSRRFWKIPISVTLDKDVYKTLSEIAQQWGVSRSSVVQQAIVFLAKHGNKPELNKIEAA